MSKKPVLIYSVLPDSIAEEAGVEPGDVILSINGEYINDIFDYRFLITNENLLIELQKKDGEVWEVEVEKEEYEDIGIEFENTMIDDAKSCRNKCIFCFIDQLPEGMRETLYFKDDDSRLSFFMGNYVTLTNMSYNDIDRIIKYRMSPINVSVHTTNPELRVSMLSNKTAGDILEKIMRLIDSGITVNCQIVLCQDVNDGKELDRTIEELVSYYPGVNSISVVPVGITRYRQELTALKPYNKNSSKKVISQVGAWQKTFLKEHGSRVVYLADEFYIMADESIPDYEEYEDFPQIENGVGLIAVLKQEFLDYISETKIKLEIPRKVSIATGVSAALHIKELAGILEKKFSWLSINVYEIKNEFFGENVTVTGLLTGRDIVSQLSHKELGEELLLCRCMLKSGEEVFLDDYTLDMMKERLGIKISVVENSGKDFIEKILGIVL